MNRLLLALNLLFLAGFLTAALYKPVLAWARPGVLAEESIRLEGPSGAALAEMGGFAVSFGTPMATAAELWKDLDPPPVILEPPAGVACRWTAEECLEVQPLSFLPRARVYQVRFDPSLRTIDGRRLPRGLALEHRTRPLCFERPVLVDLPAEEEKEDWIGLRLVVHPEVELEELEKHLEVAGEKAVLEWRLSALEGEGEQGRDFLLVARPEGPGEQPLLSAIEVTAKAGLKPRDGGVPLERSMRHRIVLSDPLLVEDVQACRGIQLRFNREVGLPEPGQVTLVPPIPFQVVRCWDGLRLEGEFPPGQVVRVGLGKGFPGRGRIRLGRALELPVRIPDLAPSLRVASEGEVLSSSAQPELDFEAVNVQGLQAMVRTLYPNNIVSLAHAGRWNVPDHVFGPWREAKLGLAGPENAPFFGRLDLGALVPGEIRGIHQVRLNALDERGNPIGCRDVRLLQITDLGVALRVSRANALVRVASLATGLPVEGAAVRLLTPTNQELAAGMTGPDGVLMLPFGSGRGDRVPFVAEVRHGLDRTFVDLDRFGVALAGDGLAGRAFLVEGAEAWVHFDRGLVRPGETARALVAIRDHLGRAAAGREVRLSWIGPGRRRLRSESVRVPDSGLFPAALETGLDSLTGPLGLEVLEGETVLGEASCRLESFVPDRMEAFLEAAGPFVLGGEGRVAVRGRWLDGTPAANRQGRLAVRFDRARFAPAGWEDYSFADLEGAPPSGARPVQEFALDEKGEALIRFALPEHSGASQVLRAGLSLELLDPSGRPVRAALEAPVHRPDHHLGLRIREGGCDLALVDAGGKLVDACLEVEVALEARSWRWVVRRGGGPGRYESELVREQVAAWPVSIQGGRARLELPAASLAGWRVLAARAGKQVAACQVGGASVRPERLSLEGPAGPVRPGEKAALALEAPFAGTALVTLEGARIHAALTAEVPAGPSRLEVPLPADLNQPNVYAVVTLTRPQAGAAGEGPCWAAEAVSIALALEGREVRVGLEAPAEVEPGGLARIRVAAPGASTLLVALVDEGVRRLSGHPDPDPLGWFLGRRRLDSRGADTGRMLVGNPRFDPQAIPGGDEDACSSLGSRLTGSMSALIRPVVLMSEPVALDAGGNGAVEFRLPEYEGRLRAFAVAAGAAGVGAASADVAVRGPLGLMAAAPRILRPGDESRVILVVRNNTGAAGELRLEAVPLGGALAAGGPLVETLAAGESRALALPWTAGPEPGDQGLELRARLNGAERGLTALASVRPSSQFSVERIGLAVEGRRGVVIPGEWVPGTLAARLTLDGDPMASLRPALESLMHYPYGCAEQTLSRLFGLLACRSLLARLSAEGLAPDPSGMLQVGMQRLLAMRTESGGLAAWPGGRHDYCFGTVYGLDFLLTARAESLPVDEELLAGLIKRVEGLLRESEEVSLRCYGAEVLSRAGRPVASWLELLEEKSRLPEDRARLALAWARLGRATEALRLLEGPPPAEEIRRERGGFLRSETRAQAVELRARLAAAPGSDRVPGLAAFLAGRLSRPGGLTTQEQGQGLIALAEFYRAAGGEGGAARCTVATPRATREIAGQGTLALDIQGGERLDIDARGRVYCQLELEGLRAGLDESSRGGVTIERRFYDPETGKAAREFRAGRVYEVRLAVQAREGLENFCVTDLLPGGFESEGGMQRASIRRPPRSLRLESDALFESTRLESLRPDQVEARDDRVLVFEESPPGPSFLVVHRVRAVMAGTYLLPPAAVEALYDPGQGARAGGGERLVVLP